MSAETLRLISLGAGAILAVAGVAALLWRLFTVAVDEAIGSRIDRLARAQQEQDQDFHEMIRQINGRLDAIAKVVVDVRSQMYPNGGESLRDKVDQLYEIVLSS